MIQFIVSYLVILILGCLLLINMLINKSVQSYILFAVGMLMIIFVSRTLTHPKGLKYNSFLLPEEYKIILNGEEANFSKIANLYKPKLYSYNVEAGNNIIAIYYKGALRGNMLSIIYYFCWNDETHPMWLINSIYKIFRYLYYGSMVDIEFIQLDIDIADGRIVSVLFEKPDISNTDFLGTVKHVPKDFFLGKKIMQNISISENKNIQFIVTSWNHLFDFAPQKTDLSNTNEIPLPPMTILNKNIFYKYNMFRRSNGDF